MLFQGKWTNAGYLKIPLMPIYGIGGLILIFLGDLLQEYGFWLKVFIFTISLTTLEFIGGWFSEKVLGVKLWDYSNHFMNLYGWVDIEHIILWLITSLLFLNFIYPIHVAMFK